MVTVRFFDPYEEELSAESHSLRTYVIQNAGTKVCLDKKLYMIVGLAIVPSAEEIEEIHYMLVRCE